MIYSSRTGAACDAFSNAPISLRPSNESSPLLRRGSLVPLAPAALLAAAAADVFDAQLPRLLQLILPGPRSANPARGGYKHANRWERPVGNARRST